MRISFISHEYPPLGGGAATALEAISSEIAKAGHKVQVVSINRGRGKNEFTGSYGREVVLLPAGRESLFSPAMIELLRSYFSLRFHALRHIQKFQPDVVAAFFSFPGGRAALPLAKKMGKALAVSLRGSDVPGFKSKKWGCFAACRKQIIRPVFRKSGLLITNGTRLYELASGFFPSQKMVSIPNGVDSRTYHPRPYNPEESGPPRLLFSGQLIERKNILLLLSALRFLQDLPLRLTVAGGGPLMKRAVKMAEGFSGLVEISFKGAVSRDCLPALYREHDILVHLSEDEGVSNTLLEAMASGLAVLALPGAVDASVDSDCIVKLPDKSERAIALTIRELFSNRERLADLKRRSREFAGRHSWENTAALFIKHLSGLAGIV